MALKSRVLDASIWGEETTAGTEAGNYNLNILGHIVTCTLSTQETKEVIGGIRGGSVGHLPTRITPLTVRPVGQVTFHPIDFKWMKYVISDYAEAVGKYTLNNETIAMPKSLSVKGSYDGTKGVRHLGVYLNNIRFGITSEGILTISADLIGLFADTFTGAVSYTAPTTDPLTYVGSSFTVDNNEWDLQSLNLTFNPRFIQKFSISSKTATKLRFPTDIIRGGKIIVNFDGVCNVQDLDDELNIAYGGSVSPADFPTNNEIILKFVNSDDDEHTLTSSVQFLNIDVNQTDAEEDAKTISFTGVGIQLQAEGDL